MRILLSLCHILISASSLRNEQHFPFLQLPAELRNAIYDYALPCHQVRISDTSTIISRPVVLVRLADDANALWEFPRSRQLVTLTDICRQIRDEAKLLTLSAHEFSCYTTAVSGAFRQFRGTLGSDQQNAITHFRWLAVPADLKLSDGVIVGLFGGTIAALRELGSLRGLRHLVVEVSCRIRPRNLEGFESTLLQMVKNELQRVGRRPNVTIEWQG